VLAHLPAPTESVLLEQLGRRAEEKPARRLAAGGHLGDGLDNPAAGTGDIIERALQRGPRDSLATVPLVDEDAGDPASPAAAAAASRTRAGA
jgi:hypothetical protein